MDNAILIKKQGQFLPVIDGLRAIAILSVILLHSAMAWPWTEAYPDFAQNFETILDSTGVPLFFIISGFCIVRGVLNHRQKHGRLQPVGIFLKRRFKRIYPPYFACLLIFLFKVLLVDLWLKGSGISTFTVLKMVFYNVFFLQIVAGDTPHINPAFWSLCVEAQFYVLVACVLAAMRYSPRGNLAALLLIVLFSGISFLAILGVDQHWIEIEKSIWFMSILRSWPFFLFGGIVAGLLNYDAPNNRSLFIFINLLLVAVAITLSQIDSQAEAFIILAFWFAMPWRWHGTLSAICTLRSLLSIKPLLFIGQISYSAYLIHGLGIRFIGNKITDLFNQNWLLGFIGAAGLYLFIIAMSYAFFLAVERHWLRSVERLPTA